MNVPYFVLIEAGMDKGLEEVVLVYAPEDIQKKRLVERDKISDEDALLRVRSQMPIEKKREFATIIIDNSGPIEAKKKRALEVFDSLKRI